MQQGESELLLLKRGGREKDAKGTLFHRYGGVVGPAVCVGSVSFLPLRFFSRAMSSAQVSAPDPHH